MTPIVPEAARPRLSRRFRALALLAIAAWLVASCGSISTGPPSPTPADFSGIAAELAKRGVGVDHVQSGDAGCADHVLSPTAIGFDAAGLDQTAPVRIHLYAFKDHETFERLRSLVDACARQFVTDPQTYESIDASPFVLAGQGPWGTAFETAIRQALEAAAATRD